MAKTSFAYPVEKICGKISKHSKVVHRCNANGSQSMYLQGERNLEEHPITADEIAANALFESRAKAANARLKKTSSTYAADLAAYRAQLSGENPVKGFQKYIWSLVKADITE